LAAEEVPKDNDPGTKKGKAKKARIIKKWQSSPERRKALE